MKPKQEHAPLNILLADDDTDNCFFFDKALKEIPIATHLTTVYDGEQLMNYLFKNSDHLPDVLFLDLNMPRKTGFECLVEIKENEKLKDLPVIIFSTLFPCDINYEQGIIDLLYQIGMQDYFGKPPEFSQFKQIIQQSLTLIAQANIAQPNNLIPTEYD
ncbi:MAG TPA: response regulator [Prolixibacteraceae bacterium]|nr:response regulator [Prolixibacteraceae bacterium]